MWSPNVRTNVQQRAQHRANMQANTMFRTMLEKNLTIELSYFSQPDHNFPCIYKDLKHVDSWQCFRKLFAGRHQSLCPTFLPISIKQQSRKEPTNATTIAIFQIRPCILGRSITSLATGKTGRVWAIGCWGFPDLEITVSKFQSFQVSN